MNAPDPNPTLSHAPPSGDETPLAPAAPTHTFDPAGTVARPPVADGRPEFPGYEVLGEIARGGMGVVYAVRDRALGCEVAVKTLLPGADRTRFEAEARVTARLPHPNIPPVHQLGTAGDGRPFLAMKLVRGQTLAVQLRARPDPTADLSRFVQIFEQICLAVGFAHENGVVHRDLKPANVMVGTFGEVQVMDWGLAKELRIADCGLRIEDAATEGDAGAAPSSNPQSAIRNPQSPEETTAGQALGTPAYMPPEQARGEWHRVGPWSDVFALGGILGDVLTGKPVYEGRSGREVLSRAAAGDVGDALVRIVESGADAGLAAIATRCLAADPAARFPDGRAVAAAVAAYRAGVEERLRAAERERAVAAAEAREQRKRRRVQLALVSAVLLFVVAGAAAAVVLTVQASGRRERAARDEADRKATEARLAAEARLAEERAAATAREAAARNGALIGAHAARCEAALRDRDSAAEAAEELAEIDRLLPGGGAEPFAARVARCRADLTALRELDRVDAGWWGLSDGKRGRTGEQNAARLARAFAALGLSPADDPAAVAARVNGSLVRARLVGALDLWLVFEPNPAVRAVLAAADPHPYRDRVRDGFAAVDGPAVRAAVGRPEFFDQPPRFQLAVCSFPHLPADVRLRALEDLADRRPDHRPTIMTVAAASAGALARVRWYWVARALGPNDAVVLNNLGVAYRTGKVPDAAVALYRKAIGLEPGYAPAHNNLGVALSDKKDMDGALACFRKCVELDPTRAEGHYNVGQVLLGRNDFGGALAAFREALRRDPKLAAAHTGVGLALAARNDFTGALAAFERATELDPTDDAPRRAADICRAHLARARPVAPPPRPVTP